MNVVLIPAWRRPEMLWHCLRNIERAEGAKDLHYIFRFDTGYTPELHEVVKGFSFSHEITETPRTAYQLSKQSYSLITGYHYAAGKSDDLVYMIEEDVMVATDFFRWHAAVHRANDELFCSIAVANPNRTMEITGEHDEYYHSTGDYCSLGVCFQRDTLLFDVISKVGSKYYTNPIDYCKRQFPDAPFGYAFAEQDGLIRRIQHAMGIDRPIAYPLRAKAYHAGLYGKNRGAGPGGTLAARLKYVADVIYSDEAMRTFAKHPEWYEDSKPIDLNAHPWTTLKLKKLDPQRNPLRV